LRTVELTKAFFDDEKIFFKRVLGMKSFSSRMQREKKE
jgi:hypothetical protein